MISGANEKELDLATARTDILLMCGTEPNKLYYVLKILSVEEV